jgi:hypothetical protein
MVPFFIESKAQSGHFALSYSLLPLRKHDIFPSRINVGNDERLPWFLVNDKLLLPHSLISLKEPNILSIDHTLFAHNKIKYP